MASKKKRKKKSSFWLFISIPLLTSLFIVFAGVFAWLMWGQGDSQYAHAVATTLFPERSLASVGGTSADKELYNMRISAAVTHSERGSYHDITIDSGSVILKNKTVLGDLIISPSAGKGDIELHNIVVRGKIVVNGSGKLTLDGVTAPIIEANSRYGTEYLVTGETSVQQFIAYGEAVINETDLDDGYYGIKRVTAEDGDQLKKVLLKSGTVEQSVSKIPKEKVKS